MKKAHIKYHVLFWAGIYLLWVLLFHRYSISLSKTMTIEFCYLIFITIDYYLISEWIIHRYLQKKRYSLFITATFMVISISSGLRAWLAFEMNRWVFLSLIQPEFPALYLNSIVNISLWVFLVTIGKLLLDRIQTHRHLENLEKIGMKTELDFLKAQVNPHALFNSLNTIYGHIDRSNQLARNVLLQFSEILRYQLYDCTADKVNLQMELEYVRNYVAFQRLRKNERLAVNLEIENTNAGLRIAPLLLVVLIENAFKFVSNYCDRGNEIDIRIQVSGTILRSSFFNTTESPQVSTPSGSNGIGIVNLRRRLELLYPEKHNLSYIRHKDHYETFLTIDLI